MLCFRKIPVARNSRIKEKGIRFSVESFLYDNAENFGKGTLLCRFSENFRQRIRLWIRGGGGYQDFPSKVFCLEVPKIFAGNPSVLCFRKISVAKKIMDKRGYQDFPSKIFSLTGLETFAREPYCVVFQKNSGSAKGYGLERGYQDLLSKNFCLTMPKTFNFCKGTICFEFQKTSGSEKNMDRRGVSRVSVDFFVSHCRKLSQGTLLCCVSEKFWQRKRLGNINGGIKIFHRKFV